MGNWIKITGNAIYTGKPCEITGSGKNFALRDGDKVYLYVHDLSTVGDANVTPEGGGAGEKTFNGVAGLVKSVCWTDNGQNLDFSQDGDTLKVNCPGYEYGKNLVVRVAEVTFI